MASLPLDVHEVLEQEYEAHYRTAPAPLAAGVLYDDAQILDPVFARSILIACDLDDPTQTVETLLNAIVQTGRNIDKLAASPVLTENGLTMVKNYESYVIGKKDAAKERVRRRIVDTAFAGAVKPLRDVRLASLYAELHAKPAKDARAALCFSGGGIRSATFALGVLQGLAGAGILDKFEYLSTVSGGGYIGGWLSSWARRHRDGMTGVQRDLVRGDTAMDGTIANGVDKPKSEVPQTKIEPEAQPVRHLREYSNYLSPRMGATSADTWTIVSLYVRNLLLNLLVLVPILAFVIAFPRFFAWSLGKVSYYEDVRHIFDARYLLTLAIVFIAIGFEYLGAARPVAHGRKEAQHALLRFGANARFVIGCAIPLTISGFFLALFWARQYTHPDLLSRPWFWWHVAVGWLVMILAPFVPYYARLARASASERRDPLRRKSSKKFGLELFAAIAGIATNAGLLVLLATKAFAKPLSPVVDLSDKLPMLRPLYDNGSLSSIYICVAVPLVLLVFFVQATVFVGLSSRLNEEYDREWWGRAGAWLLIFAALLAIGSLVTVYGPVFLYKAPAILGSLGGISGIAAAIIGHKSSSKSSDSGTSSSMMTTIAGAVLVPLFCLALLAAISLATTALVQAFNPPQPPVATKFESQFESSAEEKVVVDVGTHKFVQTTTVPKAPVFSIADTQAIAHLRTIQQTHLRELVVLLAAAVLGWLLSLFIGVNRFSMHAFYRNRLIRAYLGASRYLRDPDQFTGFDANDNLQMYELRPELIWASHFTDGAGFLDDFAAKKNAKDAVAVELWKHLDRVTQQRIDAKQHDGAVLDAVTDHMNAILSDRSLPFAGKTSPRDKRVALATISEKLPAPHCGPMHVLNTTLNLTSGENLAWQQRKAESFTISPMHCGSLFVGYRDAREYGQGISLGNAVTISGAAASPNMGYYSSAPLAFLMTLFNVRLGTWLGNPGVAGASSYRSAHPTSNLRPLIAELSGSANDASKWIYLSDGGHFENLAMYEMVLRRCRFLVVSDAASDPTYGFSDLGNAIRKIRIDLGVPIDIERIDMVERAVAGAPMKSGSYVAMGRIRYSAIDGNAPESDGVLLYLKPGLYEGDYMPRDVYSYAQGSPTFPHETTADQFFSESQFESYRALGRHAINVICGNYRDANAYAASFDCVADFVGAVGQRAQQAPPATAERIEVTTTDGTKTVAQATGDAVKIRIRPTA